MQNSFRPRFAFENGSWKVGLLQGYFMPADVVEIMKIRVSPRQENDTLVWGPGKFVAFSVRSAYQFGFEETHRSTSTGSSSRPDGR